MKNGSIEEIGNIVKREGLGYVVHNYLESGKIEDVVLSKLWHLNIEESYTLKMNQKSMQ